MGQISDSSGNIITRQGDTFYIDLELSEEESLQGGTLYVQIINEKRQQMLPNEVTYDVVPYQTTIRIPVSASNSDLLTVKRSEDYAEYYYAVKHCSMLGIEDTWVIGGSDLSELPTITVYPKVVNGGASDNPPYTPPEPEPEPDNESEENQGE